LFKIQILFKLRICSKFKKFVQLEFCSNLNFLNCLHSKKKNRNKNIKNKISFYWAGPTGRSRGQTYPSSALSMGMGMSPSINKVNKVLVAVVS
jgi:hypothetical protein